MEDEVASARKLSQLLATEDKHGYVEEEETWITAQIDEDKIEDGVKFFFVATPVDGDPYVLTYSQFQDLTEKGVQTRIELPQDIERKAFNPGNWQEPNGERYVHVHTQKTIYK